MMNTKICNRLSKIKRMNKDLTQQVEFPLFCKDQRTDKEAEVKEKDYDFLEVKTLD